MTEGSDRVGPAVAERIDECREGDVADRIETLDGFADHSADVERDVAALSALGNDTRYEIARLLAAADRELCVCEITPVVEVGESAVSHALSTLHDAGLVTRRKEGTWRYYVTTDRAEAVLDALDRTPTSPSPDPVRVAFVCVANAGRSQMAAAFADHELDHRDLAGVVEVLSGGTDPAETVHTVVTEAMAEVEADLRDVGPQGITPDELSDVDVVVTMGCSAEGICPATWRGDARDWDMDDPKERSLPEVRAIRDEIHERVVALVDELEPDDA